MRHIAFKHQKGKCPHQEFDNCPFCNGELFKCTVCNAIEGELTTDCPGRSLTEIESQLIYNLGVLDFIGKNWILKP